MYLPLHLSGSPVIIGGLKLVVFAFVLIRYLNKSTILCPVELRTQCVHFWIFYIELSGLFKLSYAETAAIFRF